MIPHVENNYKDVNAFLFSRFCVYLFFLCVSHIVIVVVLWSLVIMNLFKHKWREIIY